jgi:hypothetical protein
MGEPDLMDRIMKWSANNQMTLMIYIITFIIFLTLIMVWLSPITKYYICQADRCWAAEKYEKTSNGLIFYYDDKRREIVGDYIIKEN